MGETRRPRPRSADTDGPRRHRHRRARRRSPPRRSRADLPRYAGYAAFDGFAAHRGSRHRPDRPAAAAARRSDRPAAAPADLPSQPSPAPLTARTGRACRSVTPAPEKC